MIVTIPEGFMNVGVSGGNILVADNNSSSDFKYFQYPLPQGKWKLMSVDGCIVILKSGVSV